MASNAVRYPIGKYHEPEKVTEDLLESCIGEISTFPKRLRAEVENLSEAQLDTPYREGGWTIRQLVNHCADSHMNSLIRFKLALTEDQPTIKPYFEDRWAELADSTNMPIEPAMQILEGLHIRWVLLLKSLSQEQLERSFLHPENGNQVRIKEAIGLYAWHCNHHLAHIQNLKLRRGWI